MVGGIAEAIPYPQWEYQHHIHPVVPVPLAFLKSGKGNQFRLRVSPEHSWKWPQSLIYGVRFRVYDPANPTQTGRTEHMIVDRIECVVRGLATADFNGDIDLVGANWSGPYQPVELWENRSAGGPRHRKDWPYRVLVRVKAAIVKGQALGNAIPLSTL